MPNLTTLAAKKLWIQKFMVGGSIVPFIVVSSVAQAPVEGSTDVSTGLFEVVVKRFQDAGFVAKAAQELAALPLGCHDLRDTTKRCEFYRVTFDSCDGITRRSEELNVGTVCLEALIGQCLLPTGASGEKALSKVTTAASGKPASACALVEVEGPRVADVQVICDQLADCSCWPTLSCASLSCVPVSASTHWPTECPSCPRRAN